MNAIDRLRDDLGRIDIYLLDLLLREEVDLSAPVLDAGCGGGRNMELLVRAGVEVHGVDENAERIQTLRRRASAWGMPQEHLHGASVGEMPFHDETFSLVICNAVLHFARSEEHFGEMLRDLWRVLKPGGILFCRLASTTALGGVLRPASSRPHTRWFLLPDGSERFLVDEDLLMTWTRTLGGVLAGPMKTVHVHGRRSMTNWVLRRPRC